MIEKGKIVRITKFIVPGDPGGYLRMTQGQVKLMKIPRHKLTPNLLKVYDRIERYLSYKEFVNYCGLKLKFERSPRKRILLHVMIYFRNNKHPDPENVRKGIQDALFTTDKYVAGCYDFDYDKDSPRAEIEIVEAE